MFLDHFALSDPVQRTVLRETADLTLSSVPSADRTPHRLKEAARMMAEIDDIVRLSK